MQNSAPTGRRQNPRHRHVGRWRGWSSTKSSTEWRRAAEHLTEVAEHRPSTWEWLDGTQHRARAGGAASTPRCRSAPARGPGGPSTALSGRPVAARTPSRPNRKHLRMHDHEHEPDQQHQRVQAEQLISAEEEVDGDGRRGLEDQLGRLRCGEQGKQASNERRRAAVRRRDVRSGDDTRCSTIIRCLRSLSSPGPGLSSPASRSGAPGALAQVDGFGESGAEAQRRGSNWNRLLASSSAWGNGNVLMGEWLARLCAIPSSVNRSSSSPMMSICPGTANRPIVVVLR